MELNVEDVYDVSTRHLRTLFTYWCHVCCLRFRPDNLVVDGKQMVSVISVHGRGSLFDVYSLLHFSLLPVGFPDQVIRTLVLSMDTECPVVRQWPHTPTIYSQVTSLKPEPSNVIPAYDHASYLMG